MEPFSRFKLPERISDDQNVGLHRTLQSGGLKH